MMGRPNSIGFTAAYPLTINGTGGRSRGMSARHAPDTRRMFCTGRVIRTRRTTAIRLADENSTTLTEVREEHEHAVRMELKVGDRVRVVGENIIMYHMPGMKKEPVDMAGLTGTICKDVSMQDGVLMSATAPYVVELDDYSNAKAHFADSELELIEDAAPDA